MASRVLYLSVDQKGRATLPDELRRSLGLRPGDLVLLEKTKRGTYELRPAAPVPRDQRWFHPPELQNRLRKAEADVSEGRATVTRTVAKAQALEAADECDRDEPGGGCSRCSRMGLCPSCGSGSPWRCGCDV